MKGLLLLPFLLFVFAAGCSKTDALMDVPDKMDKMNKTTTDMVDKMDSTNAAIHDQQVLIPYKELLDPANGEVLSPIPYSLSPIPYRLMAYGEKLAEAVTATELVKIVHLHLREFEGVTFEEKVGSSVTIVPSREDQIVAFDRGKSARLTALMILAGFVPEKTLNEVIEAQIKKSGPYEETAYKLLMLRYQFIKEILLDASALSGSLTSIGQVEEAIKYTNQLESLSQLPFWSRLAFTPKGFYDSSTVETMTVKQEDVALRWNRIKDYLSIEKILAPLIVTGHQNEDEALALGRKKRFDAANAIIESKIQEWKLRVP